MNKKIFITESSEETQRLGRGFAKNLNGGDIVALYGDLGSGKTTFVQGLAEGLGIKKRIVSPTFIIIRSYPLQIQNSKFKIQNHNLKVKSLEQRTFYHIDLYRVDDNESIKELGIEEIANNPENIVAIEWAEKMGDTLPKRRIDIEFSYIDCEKRKIVVHPALLPHGHYGIEKQSLDKFIDSHRLGEDNHKV